MSENCSSCSKPIINHTSACEHVIGIVGQPNVGKTTLFNALTGLSQRVGNWPGKTVDCIEGKFSVCDRRYRIVDIPGTYSLAAGSPEEHIAIEFVTGEHPDVLICVADASSLERSLYFLSEIMCLGRPTLLALNMIDVAQRSGVSICIDALAKELQIPVVPLIAREDRGIDLLKDMVDEMIVSDEGVSVELPSLSGSGGSLFCKLQESIRQASSDNIDTYYELPDAWFAAKLLERDKEALEYVQSHFPEKQKARVRELLGSGSDVFLEFASSRYEWIARVVARSVRFTPSDSATMTDRIDQIALHPFWGGGLLALVLGTIFYVVFAITVPVQEWFDVVALGWVKSHASVLFAPLPDIVGCLLVEGVIGGAGLVLTFLPILVGFFFALALLEDTGYLARAAYIMDRFMTRIGLHGKSAIPLFLGFGCNVPAVMGMRILESRSGRILAILLAPLVPCSARFVILAFFAPIFFGGLAGLVSFGLVVLNLVVLMLLGFLLHKTVFRAESPPLVMELPRYHKPNPRTVAVFVLHHTKAFIKEAGTIIVLFSVVLWGLSAYPGPQLEDSFLGMGGKFLEPFGALIGCDWRMLVALFSGVLAKENVIASLGILYGVDSGTEGLSEVIRSSVSPAAALAFLVASMLFVPCVPTIATIRKELNSWTWMCVSVGMQFVVAVLCAVLVYQGSMLLGL